jgi:hypothetical protein
METTVSSKIILFQILLFLAVASYADQHDRNQAAVVLDEDMWIAFYDLPSRRFRAIRTAIISQDHEAAARDLAAAANYISVEAERASAVFQAPLRDVVEQLRQMNEKIDDVTLQELDLLFGRTHWLLAQHYLEFARRARDARANRNTSLYLWATTHHMERALLWNNVAVTRDVQATLEDLRDVAARLQNPNTSARAYREKPVVRAEQLLRKIGKDIDRRVLLPEAADSAGGASIRQSEPH